MKLTNTEEQLMHYLWNLGKAFMKELIEAYPEPKPANTTVATLLKRMRDKNFVGYKKYGNSRQYFPMVSKETYFSDQFNEMVEDYFDGSASRFASFFTKKSDMSKDELKQLKDIIDQQINER